jgi:membrane protein YqaA with SNARE-associated domain
MKLFSGLMDRVLRWSRHPRAPWYLGALSFAESSFFPIPPDVMLAPMVLARRDEAWRLAWITTVASLAGGLAGYALGSLLIDAIVPWLERFNYMGAYDRSRAWFAEWGPWTVLAAGFSPIPYKVLTIAAGAMAMPLAPFALASFAGRASRFFLVAGLLYWGGPEFEAVLRKYVDRVGWLLVALLVVGYLIVRS